MKAFEAFKKLREKLTIEHRNFINDAIKCVPIYWELDGLLAIEDHLQAIINAKQEQGMETTQSFELEQRIAIAKYLEAFKKSQGNDKEVTLESLIQHIARKHKINGSDIADLTIKLNDPEFLKNINIAEKVFILAANKLLYRISDSDQETSFEQDLTSSLSAKPSKGKFEVLQIDSEQTIIYDSKGNAYLYNPNVLLGQGENGTAFLALDLKDNSEVVIKNTLSPYVYLENELNKSKQVYGESYARNLGKEGSNNILVLGFVAGKPFGNNLEVTHTSLKDQEEVISQCLAIAKELKRIHELEILHGDITPENVFIKTENHQTVAHFIDFGAAKQQQPTKLEAIGYSPIYSAPEIMKACVSQNLLGNKNGKILFANRHEYIDKLKAYISENIEPQLKALESNHAGEPDEVVKDKLANYEQTIKLLDEFIKNVEKMEHSKFLQAAQKFGESSAQDSLLKKEIDRLSLELAKLPYDFVTMQTQFKYTEQQEIYSLGKVFASKGIDNPGFKDLIKQMTNPNGQRPALDEVVARLEELAPKSRHRKSF